MNQTSLFIPVKTGSGKYTFLSTKKVKSLQELIPEDKDIFEFLQESMENIASFETMKIVVVEELFTKIVSEIKLLVQNPSIDGVIDLLLEIDQLPVIQVIKKQ